MSFLRISNIRVDVTEPEDRLPRRVAKRLGLHGTDVTRWRILRKSLDARSRRELKFVYTVLVELPDADLVKRLLANKPTEVEAFVPSQFDDPEPGREPCEARPVVIGSGPAGLLAGYYLAMKGYRPLIIERGQAVKQRAPAVRAFEAGGGHDPENNYLFGEGGGETFATERGVPFLGRVPLVADVRVGGDQGHPIVAEKPDSEVAQAFRAVAEVVAARVSVTLLASQQSTIPLNVIK